ncbi:MAG: hypothetical protein J6J86_04785 [Lachnospiraceae bacterium]|nr:hypothetical protein [Lachnospiraceae bacterium]
MKMRIKEWFENQKRRMSKNKAREDFRTESRKLSEEEIKAKRRANEENIVQREFKNLCSAGCVEEMAAYLVENFCDNYYRRNYIWNKTYIDRIYDTVFMIWIKVVIVHIWKDLPKDRWTLATIIQYVKKPHLLEEEMDTLIKEKGEEHLPCKWYKEMIMSCKPGMISDSLRDMVCKWGKIHAW